MNVIEVHHLTKIYGNARGIIDVSFNVTRGEVFGFIGPNGAGKSTTIRTLLSLIKPTSGTATILGSECSKLDPKILHDVGYLPSEVFYYDRMSVLDLLKYSASFYKKDCTKKIYDLAEILDLDLKKKIDDLSFGNKKKVGIIQGLLHSPKLIILDEPTSGLDPLMQQTFFDLIKQENKNGATILFSSHILSEVEKMCDRVAIIKDGKIIKLDKISVLKEKRHKHFAIELAGEIPGQYFEFEGIEKLEIRHNEVRFIYGGNIDAILKKLSDISISNIHISEPELEEIFMHYYGKGE